MQAIEAIIHEANGEYDLRVSHENKTVFVEIKGVYFSKQRRYPPNQQASFRQGALHRFETPFCGIP